MAGQVRIAADAPLGVRRGRLWTAEGAAGGLRFVVGELPEIIEHETDGDPVPVAVALPLTINGRIFPRGDVDDWAFRARKGQSITAAVQAARLGSPLDSRLELFDPHGRKIAENDDAGSIDSRLHFIAKEDGEYRLRIQDANQQGGPAYVYRLMIAEAAVVNRLDSPQRAGESKVGETSRGTSKADFQLRISQDTLTLPRGGQARLPVLAERSGGFAGPIALRIWGLPAGVAVSNTQIATGQSATDLVLTTTAFASPDTTHLVIHGDASLEGRTNTRKAVLSVADGGAPVDSVLLSVALKPPFKIVGAYDLRWRRAVASSSRRYRIQRNGYTGPLEAAFDRSSDAPLAGRDRPDSHPSTRRGGV